MSSTPSEQKIDRTIPLLILLPFVVAFLVWMLPGKDLMHEETVNGDFALPAGTKMVCVQCERGEVEIALGEPGRLRFAGRSLQVAREDDQVDAEANLQHLAKRPLSLELGKLDDEGRLWLRDSPFPSELNAADRKAVFRQLDVKVFVPVDVPVQVVMDEGHITVDQRNAAIDVKSGRGKVLLRKNSGPTRVETAGDDIIIDEHRGSLTAVTHDLPARGQAKAKKGKILVSLIDVVGAVSLATDGGRVTCRVPVSASFELDLTCQKPAGGVARVVSSYGFDPVEHQDGSKTIRGVVGKGGPRLKAKSGGGAVTVLHQER